MLTRALKHIQIMLHKFRSLFLPDHAINVHEQAPPTDTHRIYLLLLHKTVRSRQHPPYRDLLAKPYSNQIHDRASHFRWTVIQDYQQKCTCNFRSNLNTLVSNRKQSSLVNTRVACSFCIPRSSSSIRLKKNILNRRSATINCTKYSVRVFHKIQ